VNAWPFGAYRVTRDLQAARGFFRLLVPCRTPSMSVLPARVEAGYDSVPLPKGGERYERDYRAPSLQRTIAAAMSQSKSNTELQKPSTC
jgi:hypothetical protein